MRDGVKLHTVIVVPVGAVHAPMILERTPYDANSLVSGDSPHLRDRLMVGERIWADAKYVMVFQDVRGKYGSEGAYTMTRPPIGDLNRSTTDDTTDAYDTIDWPVKNVPEGNGRVGMIGSSYDGWTVAMALLGPHPALKAAIPESPMVDGWMGDDWFHYGAFRQSNFDYVTERTGARGKGEAIPRTGRDDYQEMLSAGSAGAYATAHGLDQLPWWRRLSSHPAYDAFWQDKRSTNWQCRTPRTCLRCGSRACGTMRTWYGAVYSYEALTAASRGAYNHLAMGPWYHSQIRTTGRSLGPLQ